MGISPVTFVVFDVLQYKGQYQRKMPLLRRKEILAGISMPSSTSASYPSWKPPIASLAEGLKNLFI
jgi:ATP-dependent DNA ligase